MADIGKEELRKEINAILRDADLSVMSAKKVRQQLEEKLDCDLTSRKQEIDDMVMSFVNSKEDEEDDSESEEEEEENNKKKGAKRPAPAKNSKAKKSKGDTSEDEEASESEASEDDDDYEAKKPAKKKAPVSKKKGSESDSDSDWGKGGKKKPAGRGGGGGGGAGGGAGAGAGAGGGGGKGKGSGYTQAKRLSPALASLMGKDSMPRHEVVKKMWSLIKERNLYDPNNKQFAICDDDLYKVIGVKRFRTFGMMKYLKSHFHD